MSHRPFRARLALIVPLLGACGTDGGSPPGDAAVDRPAADTAPQCEPAPGPLEALPARTLPANYSLRDYTEECRAALGEIPRINCDEATEIPITVTTNVPVNADGEATGPGTVRRVRSVADLEGGTRCDRPFMIGLGAGNAGGGRSTSCLPFTRLGVRRGTDPQGRPTEFVYICRTNFFRTPDASGRVRFDDLGMIGHNPATGATCFWAVPINENPPGQSVARDQTFTGTDIPIPGETQTFWKPIGDLARSRCMGCHTNDPYIRSPIVHQLRLLPEHPNGPYWAVAGDRLNALARSTGPNREWNAHQALVSPEVTGCTQCHRQSRGLMCEPMLRDAAGLVKVASTSRAYSTVYPLSTWMTAFDDVMLREAFPTRAAWDSMLEPTVNRVRECCTTPTAEGCQWEDIAGSLCCALPDRSHRTLAADECLRRNGQVLAEPDLCRRPRCP